MSHHSRDASREMKRLASTGALAATLLGLFAWAGGVASAGDVGQGSTPAPDRAYTRPRRQADSPAGRDSRYDRSVEIPGAHRVGSKECRDCHGREVKTFWRGSHGTRDVQCEDCHGPGSLHIEGNRTAIIRLAKRTTREANGVCLRCHANTAALENWASGPHRAAGLRCIGCHQVHARQSRLRSLDEKNKACEACHRAQESEILLPYHHPLREAKMSCNDCHDPHGGTASNNLRAAEVNQLCLQCHTQYQGPFTYQHAPVTESCLKCHTPHGSMNRNLLVVSEPALCLQCHAAHHNGSTTPLLNGCTNCHSSIHGTDIPSATGGSVFIDKP